jgi:hypothetical protein
VSLSKQQDQDEDAHSQSDRIEEVGHEPSLWERSCWFVAHRFTLLMQLIRSVPESADEEVDTLWHGLAGNALSLHSD